MPIKTRRKAPKWPVDALSPLVKGSALVLALMGLIWLYTAPQCEVEWTGFIGPDMAEQVRRDLEAAQSCDVLRVDLYSPGGSVFDTLRITHFMEQAKVEGLIIEIRGHTLIASGATFVLAAGSAGSRSVAPGTVVLVHGIQAGWYGCIDWKPNPITEDQKLLNVIYERMVIEYSKLSGKPIKETWGWLVCSNAQAGDGHLLVNLGLADRVEA